MRQLYMVTEQDGYTVRQTSESGCNSEIVAWVNTKRQAQQYINRAYLRDLAEK